MGQGDWIFAWVTKWKSSRERQVESDVPTDTTSKRACAEIPTQKHVGQVALGKGLAPKQPSKKQRAACRSLEKKQRKAEDLASRERRWEQIAVIMTESKKQFS